MEKDFNIYRNSIFEKVKNEYKMVEILKDRREAEVRKKKYQREGYYFTFYIPIGGKWQLYIG